MRVLLGGPTGVPMGVGGVVSGSGSEHVWHRGIRCDGGACIEVASSGTSVLIRNSANPGVMLSVSLDEWHRLLNSVVMRING